MKLITALITLFSLNAFAAISAENKTDARQTTYADEKSTFAISGGPSKPSLARLYAVATHCPNLNGNYSCVASESQVSTLHLKTDVASGSTTPTYTLPVMNPTIQIRADGSKQARVTPNGLDYTNSAVCDSQSIHLKALELQNGYKGYYWKVDLSQEGDFLKITKSIFKKDAKQLEWSQACVHESKATPSKLAEAKKYLNSDFSGSCRSSISDLEKEYAGLIEKAQAKYSSSPIQNAHFESIRASMEAIRALDNLGCQTNCTEKIDKTTCSSWVTLAEDAYQKYLQTPQREFIRRQCGVCKPYGNLGYYYQIKIFEGDSIPSAFDDRYFKQDSFSGTISEHRKMMKVYQKQCEVDRSITCR